MASFQLLALTVEEPESGRMWAAILDEKDLVALAPVLDRGRATEPELRRAVAEIGGHSVDRTSG